MRHGKKFNHLGRKNAHRKAMLSNMACSLIEHMRITTTVAKAKELARLVPLDSDGAASASTVEDVAAIALSQWQCWQRWRGIIAPLFRWQR